MDLQSFLQKRQPRWNRLDRLIEQIDRQGMETLSREEVNEFFGLYRLVSSDLNLLTTRTGNPTVVDYLESLVARAYVHLTPRRPMRFFRGWWEILRHRFPALVRKEAGLLALSTGCFVAAAILAFGATLALPDSTEAFLPAEHLSQSPSERVAELEEMERTGNTRINTGGKHAQFTTFLFTHNIRVSCLAFALGFSFGIGTVALLIMNGAMLGSLAALYYNDGVLTFFTAWVGPHGSVELPCIFLAGMGGLMIARMQFRKSDGPLLDQLRLRRRDFADLIVGFSSLLVLAGLVEGGFSQVNEPTISYELKQGVALLLFVALAAYLFLVPVRTDDQKDVVKPTAAP